MGLSASGSRKAGRLALGVGLLVLAAYILYARVLICRSIDAVVGGPVVSLRPPIAGRISLDRPLMVGQRLTRGTLLGRVQNVVEDPWQLHVDRQEIEAADGRIQALEKAIAERFGRRSKADASARLGQKAIIAQLETRSRLGANALQALQVRRDQLASAVDRVTELRTQALGTETEVTQLRSELMKAEAEAQQQRATVEAAHHALLAREALADTYSRRHKDDLDEALTSAAAQLIELQTWRASFEARLKADTESYERRMLVPFTAPVSGRVWSLRTTTDTYADKIETLMRVVSCEHLLLFALLTERNFNRVRIGTRATFEEQESHERYEASVIQKLGTANMNVDEFPFAAPGLTFVQGTATEAAKLFLVVIQSLDLEKAKGPACEIGTYGVVRFDVPLKLF